jgi:hypothetical protein
MAFGGIDCDAVLGNGHRFGRSVDRFNARILERQPIGAGNAQCPVRSD